MTRWEKQLARLEGAYADQTIKSYSADFGHFARWCRRKGFKALPSSPEVVARYIDAIAPELKPSSLKRKLCAIRKLHRLAGHPEVADAEDVLLALRRAMRRKPGRPAQALGLTKTRRDSLMAVCSDDVAGLRDQVMLAVGFDTLCRRSELVAIRVQDLSLGADGTYSLLVRRAKNDQHGLGRTAHLSRETSALVGHWLRVAGLNNGPLLRPVYRGVVGRRSLSPSTIGQLLKKLSERAGFALEEVRQVSGHSLRVGAAQTLTVMGYGILPIMAAGGWRSMNVVARYIENVELNVWTHKPSRPG